MNKRNHPLLIVVAIIVAVVGIFVVPTATGTAATLAASVGSGETALKTCRVTNPRGTRAILNTKGKTVFLARGTLLTVISMEMHQGYISVRTRIGGRSVAVGIIYDDTNCG